ncbi:MAG TPA: FtsQ-type POTRA domain-containing protein [Dehalococcoidia bacterium]|nr:FtsQ-type POTRA domain-containing protein [Dehalococcoidia bacterium]
MQAYRVNERRRQRAIRGQVLLSDKEQRRLRRLNWRRIFIVLGVLAVIASGVLLYYSPLLRVQEVQVVGAENSDPAQLAALADLDGRSMFNLPLETAERRMAQLPLVKQVKAERVFPNKVRIAVLERRPIGYWESAGQVYVIDEEGVVLEGIQPPEGALHIVELTPRGPLGPGERVDPDAVALAQYLAVEAPARLGLTVTGLEFNPASGLTIATDAGYRVVFGDSQSLEFKLQAWQAIEQELGRDAMTGKTLDLRFGNRPSLR